MKEALDEYGVVHGRFQPLHNGHVHYILRGFEKCSVLIIGITNPDPWQIQHEDSAPERDLPSHNPFTFFERLTMIQKTLINEKRIDPSRFLIIPLPIHNTDRWRYYLPDCAVQYINVTTEWDRIKMFRMRSSGFKVKQIGTERYSGISGAQIRESMVKGDDWKSLVPATVASIIISLGGVERVQKSVGLDNRPIEGINE